MIAPLSADTYGLTDIGKVRRINQDHFLIAGLHKVIEIQHTSLTRKDQHRFDSGARALLLLVADGVGGGSGGEEASGLALDTIVGYATNSMRCFYKLDDRVTTDLLQELAQSVRQSHETVRAEASSRPGLLGMATTLTMAHVLWPRAYVVQIGDSRCYHLHGGRLEQVTKDQTIAQELVDQGILPAEQIEHSPLSNVLARSIGGDEVDLTPAISTVSLAPGDVLLLCSDGLTRHLSQEAIAERLDQAESARAACERLVQDALDAGGSDNVTVVVARFPAEG